MISIALQTTGDIINYSLVAATGFFIAVSFGLLYRYSQASQRINESTDLGRDLWEALNERMKKQDQRIVDLMAKVDVLQARAMSAAPVPPPLAFPTPSPSVQMPPRSVEPQESVEEPSEFPVAELRPQTASQPAIPVSPASQPKPETIPQIEPATAPLPGPTSPRPLKLDETSRRALQLLRGGPMKTDQLWDKKTGLDKGREHTSRVMKKLFELGLVTRDDANKPYTYQLTDEGRRYLGLSS